MSQPQQFQVGHPDHPHHGEVFGEAPGFWQERSRIPSKVMRIGMPKSQVGEALKLQREVKGAPTADLDLEI